MLDYTLTFDHWWYFYHRLQEGDLAQWNSFSLLGRIAVQWNYVPLSIFSPFLFFSELTPEKFHVFTVVGTFCMLFAMYAVGRIAGYGRYLPLLPIVLVTASGFRYWISFLHFATFLAIFPIAIAYFVSIVDKGTGFRLREHCTVALLMAVAFLGLRLELMMYSIFLLFAVILVLGFCGNKIWNRRLGWLFSGLGITLFVVATNAWQIAFLLSSALESSRVVLGFDIGMLADSHFLKWTLLSAVAEPAFLILLLNLAILRRILFN